MRWKTLVIRRCHGAFALVACGALLMAAGCGDPAVAALRKSDELFVEADKAQTAGDQQKALDLFTQAIAAKPTPHAYLARAKLHMAMKNEAAANADIDAGLAIDGENRDLQWLREQMKKPETQRFKGKEAEPPSANK